MIKFTFIAENKTDNPPCEGEHGLSIVIETEEKKILFDTGASEMFAKNAGYKHINLADMDLAVISHGHYDHTGGVPLFCRLNDHAPVYIHKDAFGKCYGASAEGEINKRPCSILWTEEERRAVEPRLALTDGPLWLTDNIVISGTIPDVSGNVPTEKFYEKLEDGTFKEDSMRHEQFLAVRDREKGVFVFSGCGHKGVIPVLEYTKKLFPGEKIYALTAGMHLYSVSDEVRAEVVEKVVESQPEVVIPVHCTGIDAICMLKSRLGAKCIAATAGDRYEY